MKSQQQYVKQKKKKKPVVANLTAQTSPIISTTFNNHYYAAAETHSFSTHHSSILNPSCNVRYDIYPFYNQTAVEPPPPPTASEEKQNNSNLITILVASLSATFGLALVSVSGFFIWRRNSQVDRENSQGGQLLDLVEGRIPNEHSTETFSGETVGKSQEFPSIQLDILHAATDYFSHSNKVGEGGFGPVYKGCRNGVDESAPCSVMCGF
ncbi:hypothetical protein V6N12_029231 [Hibiscus sabdariffa]|uniref:Uncharacterized protein n=1 Tax=Hibiscus sabdariffa TaxID=183260 RepID=A0ABR2CVJ1_9ROSI